MESFIRVATLGSFSAAAKQLGVSRALLSQHVAKLEQRLRVQLLNRTTRSLTLTETARAIWSSANARWRTLRKSTHKNPRSHSSSRSHAVH
jgi:DNA-binding transcriptional LysR family regulator